MRYLRSGGRIPVELPVVIRWKSGGKNRVAEGKTASISSNGVLLSVPVKLPAGTPITVSVDLPVEFTKMPLRLVCKGRVAAHKAKSPGLSAVIDSYQLRPARGIEVAQIAPRATKSPSRKVNGPKNPRGGGRADVK